LIPILQVQRGVTYTFHVEGGDNSTNLEDYHPFYITDSDEGARAQKTSQDKELETVFAGLDNVSPFFFLGLDCDKLCKY